MTTTGPLKDIARKIIEFITNKKHGAETWDQQPSAPRGGFVDRAGFVLIGDVECYADILLIEQGEAMLRTRIAKITGEGNEERFSIVTLDFSADRDTAEKAIKDRLHISGSTLIDILGQSQTVPELIHVSNNTGRDSGGNLVGTRYEYSEDQIMSLSENERNEFFKMLELTFDSIMEDRK